MWATGEKLMTMTIDYTCECDSPEDGVIFPRGLYLVTDHDGSTSVCAYCDGCADMAGVDWNGNTANITKLADPA